MILNIRGGSGSGKSWLVREFLRAGNAEIIDSAKVQRDGRPTMPSSIDVWRTDTGVLVPGRYNMEDPTPGSGGDHVGSLSSLDGSDGKPGVTLLRDLAARGPVVWESVKGVSFETYTKLSEEIRIVWATLDTPPDEAIRRIYRRRELSGRRLGLPLKEDSIRGGILRRHREAVNPPPGGVVLAVARRSHAPASEPAGDVKLYGNPAWDRRHENVANYPEGDAEDERPAFILLLPEEIPPTQSDELLSAVQAHTRVKAVFPYTDVCAHCDAVAEARRHDLAFLKHPEPHTAEPEDYVELCRPCHTRFDKTGWWQPAGARPGIWPQRHYGDGPRAVQSRITGRP